VSKRKESGWRGGGGVGRRVGRLSGDGEEKRVVSGRGEEVGEGRGDRGENETVSEREVKRQEQVRGRAGYGEEDEGPRGSGGGKVGMDMREGEG